MKINFTDYDLSDFIVRDCNFAGIKDCVLIYPQHIGVKWTQKNKIFRSSIWSKEGELISAGFFKFPNLGENPEVFPMPKSMKGLKVVTKMDGSLVICDWLFDCMFNMRTRGTYTYKTLDNAGDFEYCRNKYPKIVTFLKENPHVSLLFEITTPNLKIVLDYGKEPDFTLIGAINKENYFLFTQKQLDDISEIIKVKRPKYYSFNSLEEIFKFCEENKNIEGFCLYFNGDQSIVKCKTLHYLSLHRMKSEMDSFERVIDFWFANDMPDYNTAYKIICDTLDYEIAEQIKGQISKICDGWKEVQKILDFMRKFVHDRQHVNQKEFALETLQKWGNTNRSGFVFSMRSGKELTKENLKKLLYQVLKK